MSYVSFMKFSEYGDLGRVDRENSCIFGCRIVTMNTDAKGHGLFVDGEFGKQVLAAFGESLAAMMDHPGFNGPSLTTMVGRWVRPRIEGDSIRADLEILPSSPHRDFILDISERQPEHFGVSVVFDPAEAVKVGDRLCARLSRLLSADLVKNPAANPALFETKKFMLDPETKAEIADMIAEALAKLAPAVTPPEVEVETEMEAKPEDNAKKEEAMAERIATKLLAKFSARAPLPVTSQAEAVHPFQAEYNKAVAEKRPNPYMWAASVNAAAYNDFRAKDLNIKGL